MPYVHLRTDRALDSHQVHALRQTIVEHLAHHFAKPPARCMVQIDAAQAIAIGDGAEGCVFVEVRVRGQLDAAASEAFASVLKQDIATRLKLDVARVYLHVLETEAGNVWGNIY